MIASFAQTLKVAATGKNCQTNVRWQPGCSLGISGAGKRSNTLEEPRIKGRGPRAGLPARNEDDVLGSG